MTTMHVPMLDKTTTKLLSKKILEVLNAMDIDVDFSIEGGRFSEFEATLKLVVKTKQADTVRKNKVEKTAKAYGLACTEKDGYKMVRYDTRKHKFPFIVEKGAKVYKMSLAQAQFYFGKAA